MLLGFLDRQFPKICPGCDRALEPIQGKVSFCIFCQEAIEIHLQSYCIVCNRDSFSCPLCYQLPSKPCPNLILEALKPGVVVDHLLRRVNALSSWRWRPDLIELLWLRYLLACQLPVTHVIALPNSSEKSEASITKYGLSYFFAARSDQHRELAKVLAKRLAIPSLSWAQALNYRAKKSDRILFVGWQSTLETLMIDCRQGPWQEAASKAVLLARVR